MNMKPASGLFQTDEQTAIFTSLLEKIGAGPAALYADACMLRAQPDLLIATASFIAHTLREVERAIAGRLVPVPFTTCATCGRQHRDKPAQMSAIASLGVLPHIGLLNTLRREANELAHRAGLQRPRAFDTEFTVDVSRFDQALSAVLIPLALPVSAAAGSEILERLAKWSATPSVQPTDRERRVLESLLNKAAPGPAAWYADALALQDERFGFLFARANLVAHALREAESALRDVLEPRGFEPKKCNECGEKIDGHQQEITAILRAYEIPDDDEAARLWRKFADPAATAGLAGLAHTSSLDLPKPFDESTAEVFCNVSEIFAALFEKFDYQFGRYVRVLDELLADKNVQKKVFKNSIPHTDLTYDYFFTRVTNPQWLVALRDHDAFLSTPEPYHRDGEVVYAAWPQGVYLQRLLKDGTADVDEIFSVLERATASANPRVQERIVQAAALMDVERRRQIAQKELAWLEQGRYIPFLLAEALGELVVDVAVDGSRQLALSILEYLLQLVEVTKNEEKDLRFRVDRLSYDHLLEKVVPRIASSCRTPVLVILADALDTLRRFNRPTLTVPPVDYSYIWRAAIEPHERNLGGGLRDALIDALRDACETIIRTDPDALQSIVTWLESRQWNIYRRIALHLVAVIANVAVAIALASRAEYLDDLDLGHELSRMLRAYRGRLGDALPPELLSKREALTTAEPPLGGSQAFWVQEHSPLSRDALDAMPVPALVEFIRSWTPPPRDFFLSGQTHGGLARVIRDVVPRRTSAFSAAAMLFAGLGPVYVRNVFEGLDEAVQRGDNIEWQPVMDLGLWVADQQRTADDDGAHAPFPEEETWRYVRRAFLDLLEHATCRKCPLVPAGHWRTIWHLLQRFALDPDVGAEEDGVDDGDRDARAVEFIRSSVSGKALSLMMRFPMVLRQMQVSVADVETTTNHVFDVIDSHLEATNAVPLYTVMGRHFIDLIALDRDRAPALAASLFLPTPAGRSAWSAYLMGGVSLTCGSLLREQYSTAIEALDATSAKATFLEKRLAGHVMMLFLNGALTLSDDDLVARLFSRASPALREEGLWDVSHSLAAAPEAALPRLVALWEWCARTLPSKELRAFESWACSRRLDSMWVVDQLFDLARRGTQLSCYRLVEYLEEIFEKDPERVTRTLAALVEHQKEGPELHASRQAILGMVKRAHAVSEQVREEGRRLANLMTAAGFFDDFKEWT